MLSVTLPSPPSLARRSLRWGGALCWAMAALSSQPTPARAQVPPGVADDTLAPRGETTGKPIDAILLPTARHGKGTAIVRRAAALDALLNDTAQDLGLVLDLSEVTDEAGSERAFGETSLVELAQRRNKVVMLPMLSPDEREGTVVLRIVTASPDRRTLLSRAETVDLRRVPVRGAVMLRDLVASLRGRDVTIAPPAAAPPLAVTPRSQGRAILAMNGTLYGGFLGLSLQRSSGSDDPRLLYPLMAVGAGIGLGAAIIVADEWDVGNGDAWYLAAGAWWPAVAGHLVHEGRFGSAPSASADEAWQFGLIASASGLALSTVGLLSGSMSDGGAVLAHSGGGVGLLVGGLTEFAITGVQDEIPFAGMGYGAAIGWLLASSAAVRWQPPAARVLWIDFGMLLGGLAGASAASPLVFDEPSPDKTRGWVAAAGGGLVVGGALAWWLSSPAPAAPADTPSPAAVIHDWGRVVPTVAGPARTVREQLHGALPAPQLGVTWQGSLW